MTETKENKPDFEPGDIEDIYDKLSNHSFALRAFGALLRSSDLSDFADQELSERLQPQKNVEASNLRWGLAQIIELYLSHQESILSEHLDHYQKTDTVLIKRAKTLIRMVEQGAFVSRDVAANRLHGAVETLDIIIDREGDLRDKALELKDTCLKYIKQLKGKQAVGA